MELYDTSWLGGSDWQAKVAERRRARLGKEKKPKAAPTALVNRKDEETSRMREANRVRSLQFQAAIAEHSNLARFVEILRKAEPEMTTPVAGVLDVDLVELALHFKIPELDRDVRYLLLSEVHECVRRVNKRCHNHTYDALPWDLPEGQRYSFNEFRDAIGLI